MLAVFLNSLFVRDSTDKTTQQTIKQAVSINIESMYPGQIKKVRWKQKEVAVLYRRYPQRLLSQSLSQPEQNLHKSLQTKTRSQRPDYFVFVNAGDSSNCPLHYREGTFKDTCTSSTFDEAGRASAKTKTSFNIEIPPHYFSQNQIIFGTWEP